jgi:hypothetical protein
VKDPEHSAQKTVLGSDEPEQELARLGYELARETRRRILRWARRWITAKLGALVATGVGAIVLGFRSLPLVAAFLSAVVVVVATSFAVVARRLLYRQNARLRWSEIQILRERQARMKAKDELDAAALALASDDDHALLSRRGRHAELLVAVLSVRHRLAEARSLERPQPPASAQHRPAAPARVDTRALERRIARRAAELEELEAQVQSLAIPTDGAAAGRLKEATNRRRAAESAAMEADSEARDRRLRGLSATVPGGSETLLELGFSADGTRDVTRRPTPPTPEEIARREDAGQ